MTQYNNARQKKLAILSDCPATFDKTNAGENIFLAQIPADYEDAAKICNVCGLRLAEPQTMSQYDEYYDYYFANKE